MIAFGDVVLLLVLVIAAAVATLASVRRDRRLERDDVIGRDQVSQAERATWIHPLKRNGRNV